MTITSIKIANAMVEQLRAENASLKEQLAAAQKGAERLNSIRELCGFVENGSHETVRIGQDDATREWIVSVGGIPSKRWYHGRSFHEAIDAAMSDPNEQRTQTTDQRYSEVK